MIERQPRIALLIDADNSPASKIDVILAELAKVGVVNIRRAYGNWKKDGLKGWEAVLHEYAIRPIQQFDYSKGKNATDMGMVIEAMDLLYTDEPEGFGIVSSDADFTPLVMHLKAKGALVYGFGAKKTPMPFVNACSRFLYLENLGQGATAAAAGDVAEALARPGRAAKATKAKAGKPVKDSKDGKVAKELKDDGGAPPARRRTRGARAEAEVTEPVQEMEPVDLDAPTEAGDPAAVAAPLKLDAVALKRDAVALKRDARLVALLRNAVEASAGEDGWSPLGSVGQQIGNQASFDPRNYGYRKLIDLIDATQLFELDRRGSQFVLRDRRQARSARTDG